MKFFTMKTFNRFACIFIIVVLCSFLAIAHGASDSEDAVGFDFPAFGLRSIFRPDYSFFSPDKNPHPVSVPPTRRGCGVKLLFRGEESFELRGRMLLDARESIRIQTYIFTADETGKSVARLLKKKRKQGLAVSLIVDAYTKFSFPDRRMYADLELKGISVMGFEPAYLLGVTDDEILDLDDVNQRFHEKYWVIDEEAAFIGGTNIANEYARYGDDPDDMWRDQDVLLTGPVVKDVTNAFEENYDYFFARRQRRFKVNQAAWWARLWWKVSGTTPPPVSTSSKSILVPDLCEQSVPVRFIRSRPRYNEDYIYQAYLHLFETAQKSILIENAYFVPNRSIINSLAEASARGVAVVVITNSEATNDVSGMQPLSRYSYLPLIEAGVKIYEWQGSAPGHGSLHSKLAVIDERVTVIGSFNLDPRSIYLNSENVVLIDSGKAAKELAEYIKNHDLAISKNISRQQAEQWHRPSDVGARFKLLFGRALEEWY